MLFLPSVLALFLLQAAATAPNPGVIAGTVVDAAANTPLSKVLVTIRPTGPAIRSGRIPYELPPSRSAITEADGRFAFLNVPPGKYQLSAALPHRDPQLYLSERGSGFSTAIVVGSGVETSQLVFPYQSGGTISGTISETTGEPITGAQVLLYSRKIQDGLSRIVMSEQRWLTNRNSFRFTGLAPGTYYVAVSAHPWYSRPTLGNNGAGQNINPDTDMGYPLTYYGGTSDFASASPIILTEKGTSNIQISLQPVHNVKVTVPGAAPGQPAVQLQVLGPDGRPVYNPMTQAQDASGAAAFHLPPGRYHLAVRTPGPRSGVMMSAAEGRTVDLTADTVLELDKPSAIRLSGSTAVEGNNKPTNPILIQLLRDGKLAASARADAQGNFNFDRQSLAPGRYRVVEVGTPAFYLKAVRAKGAPLHGSEIELSASTEADLILTLAPFNNVPLHGVVTRDGKPLAGALVLLLPVAHSVTDIVRRDQSDLDGSFDLSAVIPGTYRLVAIDNGKDLAYRDPAAMAPYLAAAPQLYITDIPPQDVKVEVQLRQQTPQSNAQGSNN